MRVENGSLFQRSILSTIFWQPQDQLSLYSPVLSTRHSTTHFYLSSFGIPHCNQADPRAHSAQTYSLLTQRPIMLHLHPKVMMLRLARLLYERPRDPYLLQLKKSHPVVRKLDNLYPLWPTTPSPQCASSDRLVAVIKEEPKDERGGLVPCGGTARDITINNNAGANGNYAHTHPHWVVYGPYSTFYHVPFYPVFVPPCHPIPYEDGYARNGHEGFVDSNVPIAAGNTWTRAAIASWARDCSNSPPPPDAVTFSEELEDSAECSILPNISKFTRLSGFKSATKHSICNS
ncbi:hypothetical protein DFP72DRAFT_898009 [Ephemerocybe angulata]|uniref:Uncharacterized protein n=1 Tax=Ephemerocybe angulata TaxID=980116 RepID=A0A8H6HXE8_9AGAR|nr:hypothetical protein DFP72DRAFT_898009 [Tulosesus angulatus]